jgi:hypothetical protein
MPPTASAPAQETCPACHQPISPAYFFCPNCGANLRPAPLETTPEAQTLLYLHSIVLPLILFLTISKWRGQRYFRSQDPKERQIGLIAWTLLILSTVGIIWYAYVWTQQQIQQSVNDINAQMSI